MKKILFATSNESKVSTFSEKLAKNGIELLSLKDLDTNIDVEENGKDVIENALIKAKAYENVCDIPVMAMDNGLYLVGVPEEIQPGLFVRRVNGQRLTDNELLEHFIDLVNKYGKNGKLEGKWIYGMAIISNGMVKTYSWTTGGFYLTNKSSLKMNPGYPLDSISINEKYNKYFVDLTDEEKKSSENNIDHVIDFIKKTLK